MAAQVLGEDGGVLLLTSSGSLENVTAVSGGTGAAERRVTVGSRRGLLPVNRVGVLSSEDALRLRALLPVPTEPAGDSETPLIV